MTATVDALRLEFRVLGPLDATQRASLLGQGVNGYAVDAPGPAGSQQARAAAPVS